MSDRFEVANTKRPNDSSGRNEPTLFGRLGSDSATGRCHRRLSSSGCRRSIAKARAMKVRVHPQMTVARDRLQTG